MPETLEKLRPDRDLQCYFERPSAVAAMSGAGPGGFAVSGNWRQQFDWAVIEWNRDNTFEHPAFRYLPDGDLSGLQLEYEETRENCITIDSTLYPTVDWPHLRVWADPGTGEKVYKVPLLPHATPVQGTYTAAQCTFQLSGTPTAGDYVQVAWLDEHHTYQMTASDTVESALDVLVTSINALSPILSAERIAGTIRLWFTDATTGTNGNRMGVYANVSGSQSVEWTPRWQKMSGGEAPTRWRISLDFGSLTDEHSTVVPTGNVRKLRWTYAADMQAGAYERSEFHVEVSDWTVTGTNRLYQVASPESRRIEDDRSELAYSGVWAAPALGNYSGGSIRWTVSQNAAVSLTYQAPQNHTLYLGTRRAPNASAVEVTVDGGVPATHVLSLGEDVLVRIPLADLDGGIPHTVSVRQAGSNGEFFYFDFFEIAVPTTQLPEFAEDPQMTLATDWDTDHSLAVPPERTAWFLKSLGYTGTANHYVGALWFYELYRKGSSYASAVLEFKGTPDWIQQPLNTITLVLGGTPNPTYHATLVGDTAASIAKAFELKLNDGYTAVWAEADGAMLTIHARAMGAAGNLIGITASPDTGPYRIEVTGSALAGGSDGVAEPAYMRGWRVDLEATPRNNRAVRDWSRSYYAALKSYGIGVIAAYSTELQHGDTDPAAGISQFYPNGEPALLNTPAIQTNFSPVSITYWRECFREMAQIMVEAGVPPYLQFGETQWWYFPFPGSGMPFYDAYAKASFEMQYGRPMHVFLSHFDDPAPHAEETAHLSGLIGTYTDAIMAHVRASYPETKFEVLYPPDVNDTPLNTAVNLPVNHWTPAVLERFKTENFTFTFERDLNKAAMSVRLPMDLGFPRDRSAHLVGINDYTSPWLKEVGLSKAEGVASVVLWALDQYCLVGYPTPLRQLSRHATFQG